VILNHTVLLIVYCLHFIKGVLCLLFRPDVGVYVGTYLFSVSLVRPFVVAYSGVPISALLSVYVLFYFTLFRLIER
jgi:hypothetical protein